MQANRHYHLNKGLSLIEFMTVIAIIVISTSIATPFMSQLIARYQAEAAGHQLLATLKFCRVEALKRKNSVHCSIEASDQENTVVSKVYSDDDNSGNFTALADTLLSSTTISNTGFLHLDPPISNWSYNRQGQASHTQLAQIKLCAKIDGQYNPLNTIFIDPKGVTYINEAQVNDTCD